MDRSLSIRAETPADIPAIHHVNELAFGRPSEAGIVESVRRRGAASISLVAIEGEDVVGHILFSPVTIQSETGSFEAIALGPVAVLPSHQLQGIGSRLIRAGLEECKRIGQFVVIVLGHANYYPRFGFKPSLPYGIRWEHDVLPEAFMVAELTEGALQGRGGVVIYQPEFRG